MSKVFTAFGEAMRQTPSPQGYDLIGLHTNPFRPTEYEKDTNSSPFYTSHIEQQLQQINTWVKGVYDMTDTQSIALVGNIGVGKTRLLKEFESNLNQLPSEMKIVCSYITLQEGGVSRLTLGEILIKILERMSIPFIEKPRETVFDLLWGIVVSEREIPSNSSLAKALRIAQKSDNEETKIRIAETITRWLQRSSLSNAQMKETGLWRRVDWEGELVAYFAELIFIARTVEVVKGYYLFLDQLEDVFTSAVTDLRRARFLADIRGLVDKIDQGQPMGFILSWTNDLNASLQQTFQLPDRIDTRFHADYAALYTRMERKKITLPLLKEEDRFNFAQEWYATERLGKHDKQNSRPSLEKVVERAWGKLQSNREQQTPRSYLTALAQVIDDMVKEQQK